MTLLGGGDLVRYLLEHGLLEARAVVRDGVRVVERPRRNANHLVFIGRGGCFVKQGVDSERRASLANEAVAYASLAGHQGLAHHLVGFRRFDGERSIAVLDLIPSATSWRDHLVRTRRVPVTFARELGRALSKLHRLPIPSVLRPARAEILSLHRPPAALLDSTSTAGLRVVALAQGASGLADALDAAAANWRFETPIHGDVRWDNCLVHARPGAVRATRLALVDWELAGVGDPAWDVGCAFAEGLAAWIASMPAAAQLTPERAPDVATLPLGRVHVATRAFWSAYAAGAGGDLGELRTRAVRLAGARLLQSAFERADRATELSAISVILVQLGANLLRRPTEASVHLLALPPA